MHKSFLQLACAIVLPTGALLVALSGCGGGSGSVAPALQKPAQSVTVRSTPGPTVTPRPTPTPVHLPTPSGPPPVSPPAVVFDLRGRVLVGGTVRAGVVVQVKGVPGAVTASEQAVSGAGGFYSFFLGGGTYVVTATSGQRSLTRRVTIPPGGQTVDNFDLNL